MGSPVTEQPRVYLDANVFIAAMENPGAHSDHAWWIIHAVDEGEIAAVTSEITLAEILVKPIELDDATLAAVYEKMIVSNAHFEVRPVQRDILMRAAQLRARRKSIRLPDAIHIATALASSCSFVISDDQRLHSIDGVKAFGVNPFTLDDIHAEHK
jgi:predicted nucleic acid-binding protein